ncbi:putative cell wall glycosyl hydrolase protein [Coleophoma crateriformis]|uniref:Putative cell wall glycosyl hydrolase protein n=1 Tax=Coleophoma crateriformis TaxID=565419 RepID=A0A3D8S969_9HELO|nr:putative cell wall glycosyl hydrolase protein [Coleophoma crateriformis]
MRFLLYLSSFSAATAAAISARQANTSIQYSTLVADSFIQRGVDKTNRYGESVFYRGVEMTYNATGNESYATWVQDQIDGVISDDGVIANYPSYPFSLDDVRIGTILLELYIRTSQEKYKTAAATLRAQLDRGPRTPSGGFWHRQPTYPNQMWLDGIFMADVFYAQWTALLDNSNTTAWDDILLQFSLIEQHCRNTTTNLLVHGYDESGVAVWADPVTGASPNVWDRALGWYLMALVDVLDYFPTNHSGHAQLVDWLVAASAGVLAAQDASTGGWWLVMNEPYPGMDKNYIESSGSAMFVYALLKAVRKGYIGSEYVTPMQKGYDYLANTFVAYNGTGGTVNWEGTVIVGSLGSNATFEYYTSVAINENDLKGAGPFLYASVEYEALA